jgi:hypothetical protein
MTKRDLAGETGEDVEAKAGYGKNEDRSEKTQPVVTRQEFGTRQGAHRFIASAQRPDPEEGDSQKKQQEEECSHPFGGRVEHGLVGLVARVE